VLWIRNDLVVSRSYHGSLNFEAVFSSSKSHRKMSKTLACYCVTDCMWKRADPEWFPRSGSDLDIKFLICPDPQHCLDGYILGSEVFQKKEDHGYRWILSLFDITPPSICSKISNELFFKCTVSSNGSRETPENNIVEVQEIYILWRLRPVKTSDWKKLYVIPETVLV